MSWTCKLLLTTIISITIFLTLISDICMADAYKPEMSEYNISVPASLDAVNISIENIELSSLWTGPAAVDKS